MAISRRWPEPEQRYRAWHRGEEPQRFSLGEVQFVQVERELQVANLIGQHGLQVQKGVPPIRYDEVRTGLQAIAARAKQLGASVHMPRIGCGLAGGKWEEIEPMLSDELVAQGVPVTVYHLG
jgi:O-acetyl-ADP-ribose deacetylase (regulator of RNase III)